MHMVVVYFDLEVEWIIVFNGNCSREHSTGFEIYFFHSLLYTLTDIFLSPRRKSAYTQNLELCRHFVYFRIIP